jgi:ribosomal protein S18 acetylase RimI-like enzyme
MTVRRARDDDVPAIRRCVLDAYAVYADRLDRPPAPLEDDYGARVRAGEVHLDTVAGGELRGVIVTVPAADHLFVANLAVRPEFQRQGVGRRLLAHAERQARALGLPEVRLSTHERMTENRAFYAARGYRETGAAVVDGRPRVSFAKAVGGARRTPRPRQRFK